MNFKSIPWKNESSVNNIERQKMDQKRFAASFSPSQYDGIELGHVPRGDHCPCTFSICHVCFLTCTCTFSDRDQLGYDLREIETRVKIIPSDGLNTRRIPRGRYQNKHAKFNRTSKNARLIPDQASTIQTNRGDQFMALLCCNHTVFVDRLETQSIVRLVNRYLKGKIRAPVIPSTHSRVSFCCFLFAEC